MPLTAGFTTPTM